MTSHSAWSTSPLPLLCEHAALADAASRRDRQEQLRGAAIVGELAQAASAAAWRDGRRAGARPSRCHSLRCHRHRVRRPTRPRPGPVPLLAAPALRALPLPATGATGSGLGVGSAIFGGGRTIGEGSAFRPASASSRSGLAAGSGGAGVEAAGAARRRSIASAAGPSAARPRPVHPATRARPCRHGPRRRRGSPWRGRRRSGRCGSCP